MFWTHGDKIKLVRLEIPLEFLDKEYGFTIKKDLRAILSTFYVVIENEILKGTNNSTIKADCTDEELTEWLIKYGYHTKPLNKGTDNNILQLVTWIDTQCLINNKIYNFIEGTN